MADIDLIARNPLIGDKVRNRRAAPHQTRTVVDRSLRGDVFYKFVDRPGVRYEASCTLESWKRFCDGAKVLCAEPITPLQEPRSRALGDEAVNNFTKFITPEQARVKGDMRSLAELRKLARSRGRCENCDEPEWRYAGCGLCFSCTTGEADASSDYELIESPSGSVAP